MTSSLRRRADITIRIMKKFPAFTPELELQLNHLVNRLIIKINRQYHMEKSKAPEIQIQDMTKLALALWSANPIGRGFSNKSRWLRKAGAVVTLISAYSGARWGDIVNLFWEDVRYITQPHGRFIQIFIRISKNNMLNEQPQCVTLKEQTEKTLECPYTLFEAFKSLQGNPKTGRIFPATGASILKVVQIMALDKNLPRPTGHTGRISSAITCSDLDIGLRRTNNFLGWKSEKMYGYYTNIRDQLSENAPASLFSNKEEISKLQLKLFRN